MLYKEQILFPTGGRSNFRIPSMTVTNNGTVLAFCNDRKDTNLDHAEEVTLAMSKKKAGGDWSEVSDLDFIRGWACGIGSAVYDNEVGKTVVFGVRQPVVREEFGNYTEEQLAEMKKKQDEAYENLRAMGKYPGEIQYVSEDDGESWREEPMVLSNVMQEHIDGKMYEIRGGTHGSAHGIQLKYGEHKGRLLCPARTGIGRAATFDDLKRQTYNCAIYSDDHGETWKTANCVQVGTGEGTLIEKADGTVEYNSRAYFDDGKRHLATSKDGGETYGNFRTDDFLIEQKGGGCNASFIRVELDELKDKSMLPEEAEDVTLFVNPRAATRDDLMICVSFNSGDKWELVKPVFIGHTGYSSLCFNPVDQHFYLLYEFGTERHYDGGLKIAEFDLEWLLSE